ncbi:hypothetical protein OESDEN_06085 [Oesophagostomum dentatum]|uniref:EF-hand domain-containing protein n=1 Tax=Oesophagostomum dentatum TaxID=61180 RepID=A0A0B1TF18_OESDE|nr:hypothetical protein OESDEN_06085 [Oesophagostomum dentatum]
MGNAEAKPKGNLKAASSSPRVIDKRIEQAFVKLAGSISNTLTFGQLKDVFGEDVAESLWKYLSDSKPEDAKLNFEEFSRHAASLMGMSTDIYITVFQPLLHLIKVCSEAAGAGAVSGDEQFIGNLANEMVGPVVQVARMLKPLLAGRTLCARNSAMLCRDRFLRRFWVLNL